MRYEIFLSSALLKFYLGTLSSIIFVEERTHFFIFPSQIESGMVSFQGSEANPLTDIRVGPSEVSWPEN